MLSSLHRDQREITLISTTDYRPQPLRPPGGFPQLSMTTDCRMTLAANALSRLPVPMIFLPSVESRPSLSFLPSRSNISYYRSLLASTTGLPLHQLEGPRLGEGGDDAHVDFRTRLTSAATTKVCQKSTTPTAHRSTGSCCSPSATTRATVNHCTAASIQRLAMSMLTRSSHASLPPADLSIPSSSSFAPSIVISFSSQTIFNYSLPDYQVRFKGEARRGARRAGLYNMTSGMVTRLLRSPYVSEPLTGSGFRAPFHTAEGRELHCREARHGNGELVFAIAQI